MPAFRAPIGTHDVLPPESSRWEAMVARFAGVVERAGYGLAISPMFEDVEVFQRVGESTDVVRKEMYEFEDKGGRGLALRPEGTASIVRAFVQHRPPIPWKTWYVAPSFRYERPQAGRYRQHHQFGIEVIGTEDPDLDVEVILLGWTFYAALGLRQVGLMLNSLGDGVCRPGYREVLRQYLDARRGELCDEHKVRLDENPLRVLDCKSPECVAVTADAPRQLDYLCEPCARHFARVRAGLDAQGVPYRIDTRLVRGLDYYTRTTFEYVGFALASAQNAIGGGGRYDGLIEEMGGPPTPAIGFGLGIERILLACDSEQVFMVAETAVPLDVFIVDFASGEVARDLSAHLRAAGLRVDRAFDGRSAKAQLRAADRSGARLAVIVGPDEAASGTVSLKDLRAGGGAGAHQKTVPQPELVEAIRCLLDTHPSTTP
ncbi:MAG TPA: histidine--tRNA ligase [Acidimicrobiales bacterium]|nr:histidine--tRNA ligase [Acidimicrobiales bacterium]